jgi:outer membrane immunogenic protein
MQRRACRLRLAAMRPLALSIPAAGLETFLTLKYKISDANLCFLSRHLYGVRLHIIGGRVKKPLLAAASFAAFVLTGAANAADLAARFYEAPPPPPVWTWTGFYIGGNIGYGWGSRSAVFSPNDLIAFNLTCGGIPVAGTTCPPPTAFDIQGGLAGLQGGYNWQFSPNLLVGIEADFDWSRIRGNGTASFPWGGPFFNTGIASFTADQNIKSFGTIRGRLGWLPAPNFLVYGTGGFAYGRVDENVGFSAGGNAFIPSESGFFCSFVPPAHFVSNCAVANTSRTATGYAAGGGFEFAPWNNITIKTEYLYVNLGGGDSMDVVSPPFPNVTGIKPSSFAAVYTHRTDFNVVRVGLNYQFH